MKKEQIFLLVSVGVAGLLVYGSMGRYTPVGAANVSAGKDVPAAIAVPANPLDGLGNWVGGRNQMLEYRIERRLPRPQVSAPPASATPWVRPMPWPGLPPQLWALLREPMTTVARPAAEKPPEADTDTAEAEDPNANQAAEDEKARAEATRLRRERAAVLVYKAGNTQICRITPAGNLEGQEAWRILEAWPNVSFRVEELNDDAASVRAVYIVGPDQIERYATVHLEKTLDNEIQEQRVRSGVRPGDRQANIDFADWIVTNLKGRYGVASVRKAAEYLRTAWGISIDAPLARKIGEFCQQSYDLEGEIRTYNEYLTGTRANDAAVLFALGDALERGGALPAARNAFRKAADAGDAEARVRLGWVLLQLAVRGPDFDAAFDELAKVQGGGGTKARALAGMANARLQQGRVDEAITLGNQAKSSDAAEWRVRMILGSALYAKGQFQPAEAEFAAAIPLEANGRTFARTNRAFALLALDKVQEAVAECETALKTDPLNYRDPLIGLGEAHQKWGDLTRAVDSFATAQVRHPQYAWTLLRIASGKTRDGAPDAALALLKGSEGIPGVLQLAPESVDALRLAGIVSGALATPDHEGAVRFLRRAKDKDPKSVDVTYDLARALAMASKRDDAIKFLQVETDPNSGVAKNDARCLGLLAWLLFQADADENVVIDSLNRSSRALGYSGALKEYIDDLREEVVRWLSMREAVDDFQRGAGQSVGGGWTETDAAGGVAINADGNSAVFVGKLIPSDDRNKQTSITKQEDLSRFVSFECTLSAKPGFEFVVNIYSGGLTPKEQQGSRRGAQGAECGLGRDRNGRLAWFVYPAPSGAPGTASAGGQASASRLLIEPVKDAQGQDRMWPEGDDYHTIRIVRTDEKNGVFSITLDGETLTPPEGFTIGGLASARGKNCYLGVRVDGDPQVQVDLKVDRVVIQKLVAR